MLHISCDINDLLTSSVPSKAAQKHSRMRSSVSSQSLMNMKELCDLVNVKLALLIDKTVKPSLSEEKVKEKYENYITP